MTIDALNLDGRSYFTVKFGITMAILVEVTINAVHAFFHMDVHHVYWNSIALLAMYFFKFVGGCHRGHQVLRRWVFDLGPLMVEQRAGSILFEDRAKDPAVAMEVRKLRVLQVWIEVCDIIKKFGVSPEPSSRRLLRIRHRRLDQLLRSWILLLFGIHALAIGFVVPPHVSKVGVEDIGARVHVAYHALAGRHAISEHVLNRMPRFKLRNGWIDYLDPLVCFGGCSSHVSVLGVGAR